MREDAGLKTENDRLRHALTIVQARVRSLEAAVDVTRRLLTAGSRGPGPSGDGPGRRIVTGQEQEP